MRRLGLLLRLAFRNVRRQARRSVLTAAAMVVGLALLIMSRALADGAHEKWIVEGVRLAAGHLAFQAPGFQARRSVEDHLTPADRAAVEAALAADSALAREVVAVAARLEVGALGATAAGAVPVTALGVEPEAETRFTHMDQRIVDGRYLAPDDGARAVVGVELAGRLRLRLGDRLVLTAAGPDGVISDQLVRVVGTVRTGIPEVDQSLVHLPLATAQHWLSVPGAVTTVGVLLDASWNAERYVRQLSTALADHRGIAVLSWREASPEMDAGVRMDDYGDYVFHGILFIIIGLAIVNTVLMSVLYRTREFGVIRALGLRRGESAALVLLEGFLLTGLSGVIGLVLGLAVTWGFFRHGLDLSALMGESFTAAGAVIDPVFVPAFRVRQLGESLGSVALIALVASLYPAWRATRIDLAEAMKFDT